MYEIKRINQNRVFYETYRVNHRTMPYDIQHNNKLYTSIRHAQTKPVYWMNQTHTNYTTVQYIIQSYIKTLNRMLRLCHKYTTNILKLKR